MGRNEIIVHAQIEAAQDALAVFGIGQHQQGRMAGAFDRAQLAAQAQAVEIGETEADDDDLVISLGGAKQRLLRVGFDIDLIGAAQRRGDALGGMGAVVHQQNPPAMPVVERRAQGGGDAETGRGARRGRATHRPPA